MQWYRSGWISAGDSGQKHKYPEYDRQIEMPLADAYDYAAGVMVENMMHAESKEGIGAFIDKRSPDWDKA